MEYRRDKDTYLLRLDVGDEVIESLKSFMLKENLKLAEINGLGAINHFETGCIDPETAEYTFNEYDGNFEIVSCHGTLTMRDDGRPYIHLHMAASNENGNCFGGHLTNAHISATGEFVIHVININVERVKKNGCKVLHFLED